MRVYFSVMSCADMQVNLQKHVALVAIVVLQKRHLVMFLVMCRNSECLRSTFVGRELSAYVEGRVNGGKHTGVVMFFDHRILE
jgi:hypothetical protein